LSAGYDEMRRIITVDDPPTPSTRLSRVQDSSLDSESKLHVDAKDLRGELDWIVMKAIEKDRTRRYETASAFADDVQRHLDNEPVRAAAPSTIYKFKKIASRHKGALASAAAMLALLVLGIVATTWQAIRAGIEKDNAIVERDRAGVERDRANTEKERAAAQTERANVARMEAEAISGFLIDVFRRVRPGEKNGGRDVKVADVLDDAVTRLANNGDIPPDRRAKLQMALSDTYSSLGLYQQSIPLLESARDHSVKTLGPDHDESLGAQQRLAISYSKAGRFEEARQLAEELVSARTRIHGAKHPSTLKAMSVLADGYSGLRLVQKALALRENTLRLQRVVQGAKHPDTLTAMNALAVSYSEARRHKKALALAEEVLEISREVYGSEHPSTLTAMNNLAGCYSVQRRHKEALYLEEKALELSRQVKGPEHPDTLVVMLNLSAGYRLLGRREEARDLGEAALKLSRRVNGSNHPTTISMIRGLVTIYNKIHFYEVHPDGNPKPFRPGVPYPPKRLEVSADSPLQHALDYCEEAQTLARQVFGSKHPTTLDTMKERAKILQVAGHHDEAVRLARRWRDAYLEVNGTTRANEKAAAWFLSEILVRSGKKKKSDESFELFYKHFAKPLAEAEQREFLKKNPRAARLKRLVEADPNSKDAKALEQMGKTRQGQQELLKVYLATCNGVYSETDSLLGRVFNRVRKAGGSVAMWTLPHEKRSVGYWFNVKATHGPGAANAVMHSARFAWALQKYLVGRRNLTCSDYPGYRFSVYAKGDDAVPSFVDWADFPNEHVLVAEPVETTP
ncbi:MAG: tetratricopeptide repeat protein, partial [Planctomycetota bacterium]